MSETQTAKVAIVGASGFSGEELISRLLQHPHAKLVAVTSRQYTGQTLAQVFPNFASNPVADTLQFIESNTASLTEAAEVIFLALPHGVSAEFAKPLVDAKIKVIDLSADFRLDDAEVYEEFYGNPHPVPSLLEKSVYGMPELHREAIRSSQLIASPGCYPTSILLPTVPLLRAGLVKPTGIIADSLSGVSGAGRKASVQSLFSECNESLRPYNIPKHRHLSEIEQELSSAALTKVTIQFTPHLVPVTRGILSTLYLAPTEKFETGDDEATLGKKISDCYSAAYADEPFIRLLPEDTLPDTKHVIQSNYLDLAWRLDRRTGRLIVMSAIDNLVKGASGQAIQNFNIACGFNETAGLI